MHNIRFGTNLILSLLILTACNGQSNGVQKKSVRQSASTIVGGPFENGEFTFIDMPAIIPSVDTSEGWEQKGQKLLITGTIFQPDGKTPAPEVILYYYHTDINGVYAQKPGLNPKVVRHGYIRGWVQSDAKGKFAIYTVRPAPYPNSDIEAHIHIAVKEPAIANAYYIDDWVFEDDPLLTPEKRKRMRNRGGTGILTLQKKGSLHVAEHDVITGLHIPDYPQKVSNQ